MWRGQVTSLLRHLEDQAATAAQAIPNARPHHCEPGGQERDLKEQLGGHKVAELETQLQMERQAATLTPCCPGPYLDPPRPPCTASETSTPLPTLHRPSIWSSEGLWGVSGTRIGAQGYAGSAGRTRGLDTTPSASSHPDRVCVYVIAGAGADQGLPQGQHPCLGTGVITA